METSFTIGEVASRAGINPSAIRYYERNGVLPAPARVNGQRRYDEDVLRRLSVLDVAKRAGFSLEDVRQLFQATDAGAPAHGQLRALAQAKLPEVEALIDRAQDAKRWLESSTQCSCVTLDECSLFEDGVAGSHTCTA